MNQSFLNNGSNQTQQNNIIQNIPLYPDVFIDGKNAVTVSSQSNTQAPPQQSNQGFDIKSLLPLLSSLGNGGTANIMQTLLPALAPNLPFDPQMLTGLAKNLGVSKKKKEEPVKKTSSYIKADEYEFD